MKLTIDKTIKTSTKKTLVELGFPETPISLEHPAVESHGDYSSNIALFLFPSLRAERGNLVFSSPRHLAETIVIALSSDKELKKTVSKIDVAGPGFINFVVKPDLFIGELEEITKQENSYGSSDWGKGKKWLIEHTSPNPNKAMHLGHLRNNVTGMAIANIWEFIGIEVIRDCIDNNRGIAIAKLMWGYLKFARKDKKEMTDISYWFKHQDEWLTPEEAVIRPDRFVDELYVKASADFEKNEDVQVKVRQLVIDWENKDEENWALWKKVLNYSYLGQQLTLNRLGNKWDKVWHEHEHYQDGKDLVALGLKKKVFKEGKGGAIVTDLEKFNIPDTVVIKADGTALYITQDLALTRLKKKTFQPDTLHWVIGPEQSLALKQMFASCDKLGIIDYKDCVHIAYGYMSIKGKGKMSSRAGTVVYIDDLIDQVKEKIAVKISSEKFKLSEMDKVAETLALGAIKYSILKVGRLTNTAFDLEESVSVDGNSGPYLQYTYARCRSVLSKSGVSLSTINHQPLIINPEELAILRWIYRFPEVVQESAKQYSPNLICTFLYELAQRFNTFYNKHRILESSDSSSAPNSLAKLDPAPQDPNPIAFRLLLTSSVSQVLKNGLTLLGIQTPEKM